VKTGIATFSLLVICLSSRDNQRRLSIVLYFGGGDHQKLGLGNGSILPRRARHCSLNTPIHLRSSREASAQEPVKG
jgi:hypothetical protein